MYTTIVVYTKFGQNLAISLRYRVIDIILYKLWAFGFWGSIPEKEKEKSFTNMFAVGGG